MRLLQIRHCMRVVLREGFHRGINLGFGDLFFLRTEQAKLR